MKTAYAEINSQADSFQARIVVKDGSENFYPAGYSSTGSLEDCITSATQLLYEYCASTTSHVGGVLNLTAELGTTTKGGTMEGKNEKRFGDSIEDTKSGDPASKRYHLREAG